MREATVQATPNPAAWANDPDTPSPPRETPQRSPAAQPWNLPRRGFAISDKAWRPGLAKEQLSLFGNSARRVDGTETDIEDSGAAARLSTQKPQPAMKSSPVSVVGILGRLSSTGVSRVSIRHGHTMPRRKQPRHELTGFKKGLGERIWVHHHIAKGMIIYTHEPELPRDSNKGLSQIPFTVKKQKPAELRRDYWAPLCLIEVPKGLGVVGRNVMQKLREFRHRHELEWGWQAAELASRSRRERGELIHNQRSNAIADIAAVLAGKGRGNRMWADERLPAAEDTNTAEAAATATETAAEVDAKAEAQPVGAAAPENIDETTAGAESPTKSKSKKPKAKAAGSAAPRTLVQANIYWSNDADRHWAREWTENVTHSVGLPEHITNPSFKTSYLLEEPWQEPEATEQEPEAAETANGKEPVVEPNAAAEQEEQPQRKKGWMGWLGGKSGSSSQETRV